MLTCLELISLCYVFSWTIVPAPHIWLHSDKVLTPSFLMFSFLIVPILIEPKHGTSRTRPLNTFK